MIPPLTDRISLLELVNDWFPYGKAVEIGIAGGHFTKQILATYSTLTAIWCVDPWKHFAEGYEDSCNLTDAEQEGRYRQFIKDNQNHPHVLPRRMMSYEFSKCGELPPGCIDFIYLDANHSFAEVARDLTCWWDILKPGGIFAGHDYYDGNLKGHGVKLAVDVFAKDRGIQVHRTTSEFCRPEGVYGAGWEGFSFAIEKPVKNKVCD